VPLDRATATSSQPTAIVFVCPYFEAALRGAERPDLHSRQHR
jgi:hypothetical protein